MRTIIYSVFFVILASTAFSIDRPDLARYEVTADRVNLRVRPDDRSEVVGQAAYGDLLSVKAIVSGWLEITMPQALDAWVHREFIVNDAVVPAKLNVRGGPGINYQVIGRVERGTRVVTRGEVGEWKKIQPPAATSLWISDEFVRKIPAPGSVVEPETAPEKASITPVQNEIVRPPSAPIVQRVQPKAFRKDLSPAEKPLPPPSHLTLIPLPGQGRLKDVSGVLIKTGFLFGRPADFRIVRSEGDFQDTICYIHAEVSTVKPYLGSTVDVSGHEYWYEGGRVPVLVLKEISQQKLGVGQ